jgi:hypothetical protein
VNQLRTYPRRRTDALVLDDGTESRLIAAGQVQTHVMNPTARAIWELCDGETEPGEMVMAICQVFDVEPMVARIDVQAALARLADAGLISWSERTEADHER